jgi:hypothetical protein
MKKLYFLDEEEKNRILNIHESATKRQYLSEQNPVQLPPNPYQKPLDTMKGEANWKGKYSCVRNQGVKPTKLTDGSSMYVINGVEYYNNGRKKMADGQMSNYACETEFLKEGERQTNITKVYCSAKNGLITTGSLKNTKLDDYIKDFTVTNQEIETAKKSCSKTNQTKQSYGNRQQIISQTENNTKAIQKLLKLPETGIIDTTLLEKINEMLNGGGQQSQPRPKVEPVSQLTQQGVTTPQITTMSPEQLTAGLQQQQKDAEAAKTPPTNKEKRQQRRDLRASNRAEMQALRDKQRGNQ